MAALNLIALTIVWPWGSSVFHAKAHPVENPRARIAAVYAQFAVLTVQKNMTGFSKLMKSHSTSDFHRVGLDGLKQSGPHFVQEMRRQLSQVRLIKGNKIKVDAFVLHGVQAMVTASSSITALVDDPNGKSHVVSSGDTSLDSWVLEKKVWKLRSMKELREHTFLDGKPMNHAPMPKRPVVRRRGPAPRKYGQAIARAPR